MKIIIVPACKYCPHKEYEVWPVKYAYCKITEKKIADEMTIPEWCKLKDKE